jgi:hypothetical protein
MFCKHLMGIVNCATTGFAEMVLVRDRDEEMQVHRTDGTVLVLGYVFGHKRTGSTVLKMAEE